MESAFHRAKQILKRKQKIRAYFNEEGKMLSARIKNISRVPEY